MSQQPFHQSSCTQAIEFLKDRGQDICRLKATVRFRDWCVRNWDRKLSQPVPP
jgi:hypothetical protein